MSEMGTNHEHGHEHGHAHDHSGGSRTKIGWAAVLTGGFMLAEIAGGLISGSLALLADAGHMAVDFAGLALAYFAIHLAARPATAARTYGFQRLPVLIAFSNGLVLFGIAAIIVVEAVRRLNAPVEILAGPMLAVAIGGLVVNIAAFFMLHGGDKEDLNLRGALLHVLGDLLGSVAAIAASLVILFTGWTPIDPILSVFVSLIILGNAYRLVRQSAHILLEGAPSGIDAETLRPVLAAAVPGLADIHHVHVWTIAPRKLAATLHARLREAGDAPGAVQAIKTVLARDFAISHATVELEFGDAVCADNACAVGVDEGHGHGHSGHAHAAPATGRAAPDGSLSMIGAPA